MRVMTDKAHVCIQGDIRYPDADGRLVAMPGEQIHSGWVDGYTSTALDAGKTVPAGAIATLVDAGSECRAAEWDLCKFW